MATLGDLIASARSPVTLNRWLESAAPELTVELDAAAQAAGETRGQFVRAAVADFSNAAGEEDWAHLVSQLRNTSDPALACIATMTGWRLSRMTTFAVPADRN